MLLQQPLSSIEPSPQPESFLIMNSFDNKELSVRQIKDRLMKMTKLTYFRICININSIILCKTQSQVYTKLGIQDRKPGTGSKSLVSITSVILPSIINDNDNVFHRLVKYPVRSQSGSWEPELFFITNSNNYRGIEDSKMLLQ